MTESGVSRLLDPIIGHLPIQGASKPRLAERSLRTHPIASDLFYQAAITLNRGAGGSEYFQDSRNGLLDG